MRTLLREIVCGCFIFLILATASAYADITIIVHAANGSEINDDTLKSIFLMQQTQFPNGVKAEIVICDKNWKTLEDLASRVCGTKGHLLQSRWKKVLFTGDGTLTRVGTDAEVIEKVASDPKYIGVINARNLPAPPVTGVKVVKIY